MFTLKKNLALQTIATAAQIIVQTAPSAETVERWAGISITLLQAAMAIAAHFRTPDGDRIRRRFAPQPPPADHNI